MSTIRRRFSVLTAIFFLSVASLIAACTGGASDRPPHVQRVSPSPIHIPLSAFAPNVLFDITAGAGVDTDRTPAFSINGQEVAARWDVREDRGSGLLSAAESIHPEPVVYTFEARYWDTRGQEFTYAWEVKGPGSGPDAPAPPVFELHLRDSHWDNNGIALWWADPDFEVFHWVVERAGADMRDWRPIAVLRPDELRPQWDTGRDGQPSYERWWDGSLPPHEIYSYRIYACTPEGRTSFSNATRGTVPEYMPGLDPPIAEREPVAAPC